MNGGREGGREEREGLAHTSIGIVLPNAVAGPFVHHAEGGRLQPLGRAKEDVACLGGQGGGDLAEGVGELL